MKRLTEYIDSYQTYGLRCELGLMRHTEFNIDKAIDKLAEYEDLGYSPEELKERLELAWMYEELNK